MTPPREPVVLVLDSTLMESAISKDAVLHIPKLTLDGPPQGDSGSVMAAAKLLVAAENPVLIAGDCVHSEEGMQHLIEFAEALQIPVIDQGRNLPSRHPLNQLGGRALIPQADVIIGLEVADFWGEVHADRDIPRSFRSITRPDAKLISISSLDLYTKSNYQDFQRFQEFDIAMAADPEATLPSLTEAVKRLTTDDRKRAFQDRGAKFAAANQKALERARVQATYGWDSSPISIPRLSAEVWNVIKDEDWAGGLYFDYTTMELRQILSACAWRQFARRRRQGAAGRGRGARSPQAWPAVCESSEGWRPDVRAGSALDRRAP